MDELVALFRFLVPLFATATDDEIEAALTLAAPYRPACLPPAQQDVAQVWYAAWIMYGRTLQQAAVAPGGPGIVHPNVQSEKEGDLQRTYRSGGSASDGAGEGDPYGFYNRWRALAAQCIGGAITVGHGHGSPCCC